MRNYKIFIDEIFIDEIFIGEIFIDVRNLQVKHRILKLVMLFSSSEPVPFTALAFISSSTMHFFAMIDYGSIFNEFRIAYSTF